MTVDHSPHGLDGDKVGGLATVAQSHKHRFDSRELAQL
jgi:hypothetical protein